MRKKIAFVQKMFEVIKTLRNIVTQISFSFQRAFKKTTSNTLQIISNK